MTSQAVFLACGLGSLGLILAVIGALGLSQVWSAQRWPSTAGEVVDSYVHSRHDGDVPDSLFQAKITYEYIVQGQRYTSNRISLRKASLESSRPDLANTITRQYPQGKKVTVFYNPRDPYQAVLELGTGPAAYFPLAAGGLFFIVGLVAMMFAFL